MNVNKLAIAAVALAGALAAASVEAHGRDDVRLSVTIGNPWFAPSAQVYRPAPALRFGGRRYEHPGYRAPTRWDVDAEGVRNRCDRDYNPRWDRDGDGIPNRFDRDDHSGRG